MSPAESHDSGGARVRSNPFSLSEGEERGRPRPLARASALSFRRLSAMKNADEDVRGPSLPTLALALPRRALRQNPLQGPSMHVQPPRRFADIVPTQLIDALDMLPANAIRAHGIIRRLGAIVRRREQRLDDVFGIGGLGQII